MDTARNIFSVAVVLMKGKMFTFDVVCPRMAAGEKLDI